ncbi:MAG: CHC2 zinc finger domain-containing protein [Planctomycetota bacterium]
MTPRVDLGALLARMNLRDLLAAEGVELDTRGWARCPLSGHEERTPSFQVREREGRQTWRCWGACGRWGDAIDLVRALRGLTFTEAVDYLRRWAGCPLLLADPRTARPRPRAARPRYPDPGAVRALCESSPMVEADPQVAAFLRRRGVDPGLVGAVEARALHPRAAVPEWAAGWRRWHRLLLPLVGAHGEIVSLKARDVTGRARAKELAPRGFSTGGTVYANASGALLLRDPGAFVPARTELLIAEGGVDFLLACAASPQRPVWGLPGSGHWSQALAARIPSGARVLVGTDPDAAGERYAQAIAQDLGARCQVLRLEAAP